MANAGGQINERTRAEIMSKMLKEDGELEGLSA